MVNTAKADVWVPVAPEAELPEGRVKSVVAGKLSLCLVHFGGQWSAMDNHCPHQGGPLGEGSIEKGVEDKCWIRCPWHGWDFDPITGAPPGKHDDAGQQTYPVKVENGEVYVGIPKEEAPDPTMTDVLAQSLANWGLKRVFGMVGHSNLGLADAIRGRVVAGDMTYTGVRHEGGAAFAASAYGKLTGKPAACLTIAGPGATNLLTGMWDAKVDRAPILALTGQVQTQVFGPGAFQDINLSSAFQAVSSFSQSLLADSKPGELAALAMKGALEKRDVSHLIFPDDVQTMPSDAAPTSPTGRLARPTIRPDEADVAAAANLFKGAKRPIIIVGHGAYDARDKVIALAEKFGFPVMTTFKGKGLIADTHPNAGGVLGRSGTPIASWFMNQCDLILALGTSFSNHTGISAKKKIIHVDFEREQMGKFHAVELPVWSDIGTFCDALDASMPSDADWTPQLDELAGRWDMWRVEKTQRWSESRGQGVHSAALFESLGKVVDPDAIIAVDVGNNTYSFGRYFETCGQRVLMSGYLGSIGFALPAGIGAWCATQDFEEFKGRQVVSVSGDGGFGQYAMEFTTAVKNSMNITHILLNNSELGKISKEQTLAQWPVWETELHNPNFSEFAKNCGGFGVRVTHKDQLDAALKEALAYNGPALVEIITDVELI